MPELERRDVTDDFDVDVGVFFYLEEVVDVVFVEEGEVEASTSCSSCPACPVDKGIRLLRRRQLNHQLYIGDVKSPGCHIGCHQHLLLAALELAEIELASGLGDIAVKDDKVIIIEMLDEVVGLYFGLCEDYCSTVWVVSFNDLFD